MSEITQLELLDSIINNSREIIWAVDHNYKLLYANKACQDSAISGGRKELSTGTNILSPEYPTNYITFWKNNYDRCFKDESFGVESELLMDDGKHYIENYFKPLKNRDGVVIASVITSQDITFRKLTEKTMEESETLLKITQQITKMGGWIYDLQSQKAEFTEYINAIFGRAISSPEDGIQFFHPEDRCSIRNAFYETITKKIPYDLELRFVNFYGKNLWVRTIGVPLIQNGNVVKIIGSVIDITDRIKNAEALQASRNQYETLFENSGANMIIIDYNGNYLMLNENAAKNFGVSKSNIIGKSMFDFLPNDVANHYIDLNRLLIDSGGRSEYEDSFLLNGEIKTFAIVDQTIKDENGENYAILSSSLDITDQQQIELKIKQQNEELKKLNADKDRFISILAHDLKNPFNSLLGFSDLLSKNIHKYDINKIAGQVNIINEISKSTYNLLEDTLLWANAQSGKLSFEPQKLNLTEICNQEINKQGILAKNKNISVDYYSDNEIIVFADKQMLSVIFRNLITNAIKFTNQNGQIKIYGDIDNYNALITVSDNGIGIDDESQKKLFDLAYKVSTKGTNDELGTGLGLLLCKEFVEKHNGKIWVESLSGKGSSFKFTIPLNVETQ